MKKSLIIVSMILLTAGLAFSGGKSEAKQPSGSDRMKIVVASDATWPPMEYINEAKELVGYDIDFMKAVAAAAGFDVEIRNTARWYFCGSGKWSL